MTPPVFSWSVNGCGISCDAAETSMRSKGALSNAPKIFPAFCIETFSSLHFFILFIPKTPSGDFILFMARDYPLEKVATLASSPTSMRENDHVRAHFVLHRRVAQNRRSARRQHRDRLDGTRARTRHHHHRCCHHVLLEPELHG
jgi:hypothetical protein